MEIGGVLLNTAKTLCFVQANQYRKEAKSRKEEAEYLKEQIEAESEKRQQALNDKLSDYSNLKLNVLQSTIGVFQYYLETIHIQNKDKEYELLNNITIEQDEIKSLEKIGMTFSQYGKTAIAMTAMGTVASAGAKKLAISGVTQFCKASTGTAIRTLHGAALKNAVYAKIGGGTVALGHGGVAAGIKVLSAIGTSAAVVTAVATAAITVTNIFSKKLTEATDFQAKVLQYKEECQRDWVAFDGIERRTEELQELMTELGKRTEAQLEYLEPLIFDFTPKDQYFLDVFNKVKDFSVAVSKLAQTPILEDGVLSESSHTIQLEISNVLNKDL